MWVMAVRMTNHRRTMLRYCHLTIYNYLLSLSTGASVQRRGSVHWLNQNDVITVTTRCIESSVCYSLAPLIDIGGPWSPENLLPETFICPLRLFLNITFLLSSFLPPKRFQVSACLLRGSTLPFVNFYPLINAFYYSLLMSEENISLESDF